MTAVIVLLPLRLVGQNAWVSTGGPQGGRIRDLAAGKTGNLFAATDVGLFRSFNDGLSWQHVESHPGDGPVDRVLAIGYNHVITASPDGSIIVSADLGVHWTVPYRISEADAISGFVFGAAVVYAGGMGSTAASRGVFRSLDSGATWMRAGNGLPDAPVFALSFDPRRIAVYAATSEGIFRSQDGGDSWQEADQGLGDVRKRFRVMAADTSGTVYAGSPSRDENGIRRPGAVYKTVDGGASWISCVSGLAFPDVERIDADPDGRTAYLVQGSRNGVQFRSTDRGASWHPTDRRNMDARSVMAFRPTATFGASPFGVHVTTDQGNSWTPRMTGLLAMDVRDIAISTDGSMVAATRASGLFRKRRGGDWEPSNAGIVDYGFTSLVRTPSGALIAGNAPGLCVRSTDGGDYWEPLMLRVRDVDDCALAVNTAGHVFLAGKFTTAAGVIRSFKGIMKSTDDGITWDLCTDSSAASVPYAALAAGRDSMLFATDDVDLWRSRDAGVGWTRTKSSPPGKVFSLACDTSSDFIYALTSEGCYSSIDAGDEWELADDGRGALQHSTICVQNDTVVYSAPGVGIRISTNAGNTWGLDGRVRMWESANRFVHDTEAGILAATPSGVWSCTHWSSSPDTSTGHLPDITLLISPAKADTNASTAPTLVWWRTERAESYSVQVSRTPDFSNLIRDTTTKEVWTRFTSLPYGIMLYWRVRGMNAAGKGRWSEIWWFMTNDVMPGKPQLLSPGPADTAVAVEPEFVWWVVDAAKTYQIQLSMSADFSTVERDTVIAGVRIGLGPMPVGAQRYWRVRGLRDERRGPWSETRWFRVYHHPPPDSVRGIWPPNGMDGVAVDTVCSWTATAGATTYVVEMRYISGTVPGIIRDTTFRPHLLHGWERYVWRVAAKNPAGLGPWSAEHSFTTGSGNLARVLLTSPEDYEYVDRASVLLKWRPIPLADRYVVEVRTDEHGAGPIWRTDTVTEASMLLTALPDTVYAFSWRVRALHGLDSGAYSFPGRFIHLLDAYQIAPDDRASSVKLPVRFIWDANHRAIGFRLQIDSVGSFDSQLVFDSILTTNDFVLDGLRQGRKYWWRVRVYNSIGAGPWSEVWSFTTGNPTGAEVLGQEASPRLDQNFPNPFSDHTVVRFSIPRHARATLRLYDVLGRAALHLADGQYTPGLHEFALDARGLAPGIYILALDVEGRRLLRSVCLRREARH